MEYTRGPVEGSQLAASNVPAFLTKLSTLLEDPDTDPLICWSPSGTSFHVYDQGYFSKEVLPKFFKHNNMASFIRQLNMYGFRKVVHMEQGGLLKPEKDDTEFQHPFFVRGQEHLLENIKRKVTNVSSVRQEDSKIPSHEVSRLLNDVQVMKGKQETIDSKINAMKHENEALWREVVCLRQKHAQQQKMVNKLIQFLVSLVQSNRIMGVKRKLPLMLNDSSSAHSVPKYARSFSLEPVQAAPTVFQAESSVSSGPIISDVTELATPPAEEAVTGWTQVGKMTNVKEEELVAPDMGEGLTSGDTPLSPTTFINSILQDNDAPDTSTTTALRHHPAATNTDPAQMCQTVVCIDKSELSDHIETIDNSLENLQTILNNQTFTFDTSPLMEFFSPSCPPGDFDISALDTLLCDNFPKGADESDNTGKQLVQYTPIPICEPIGVEGGATDLPSLLELEAEPFLNPDLSANMKSDL
ncbi:heat shock factor protein 1 [Phycodurus eques]|uniref:heat shock factor protein 1 n=1 Tax=Phycodurus eques TaxID=693459 RepID=UPI002ACD556C|nr:heat shock factor protein 1 [Phycodurus eques]XP_061520816.1 heat shock factor protein 1 [Phycodurus eques]XP_061520817.1 heat shock factor protein 1 [Phycodurus eques]